LHLSCINWLRTLPYVRAWANKYKHQGLVVIGVHTPEFGFAKDLGNVQRALKAMRVDYPVAVDYWPALYFVDARGTMRHHKFGEGDYEQSERIIQRLLADTGAARFDRCLIAIEPDGIEAPADWTTCSLPKTMSATSAPNTSHPLVAQYATCLISTRARRLGVERVGTAGQLDDGETGLRVEQS
jgi:hypothetical protein